MIPPQFIQVSEADGTFDDNKSPATWYKNKYGVTTVWSLVYNGDSITLRTEGDLANAGRSNGLQNDAGRNAGGGFYVIYAKGNNFGVFYDGGNVGNGSFLAEYNLYWQTGSINLDLSRAYTTANEFRMRNRLMRIYILQSIEGISV